MPFFKDYVKLAEVLNKQQPELGRKREYMGKAIAIFSLFLLIAVPIYASEANIDEIRFAIFNYQIARNASGIGKGANVYCLSLFDSKKKDSFDPSPEFIKRFEGHDPPVKPKSKCEMSLKRGGVFDVETGKHGIIYSISTIEIKGSKNAQAFGGYYAGPLASSGRLYYLKKKDGKWVVIRSELKWIS